MLKGLRKAGEVGFTMLAHNIGRVLSLLGLQKLLAACLSLEPWEKEKSDPIKNISSTCTLVFHTVSYIYQAKSKLV